MVQMVNFMSYVLDRSLKKNKKPNMVVLPSSLSTPFTRLKEAKLFCKEGKIGTTVIA